MFLARKGQWQAQALPQPPADAVGASEDEEEDEAGALSAGLVADAAALSPEVDDAPEPPRKSVAYQPEPLSWKPAAVTCLA